MRYLRAAIGMVIGGALGAVVYYLLWESGRSMPLVIPALLGLGAGLAHARRDIGVGIASAVVGVGLTVLMDWRFLGAAALTDSIQVGGAPMPSWLMYAIGAGLAFWFGIGRDYLRPPPAQAPADESTTESPRADPTSTPEETTDKR